MVFGMENTLAVGERENGSKRKNNIGGGGEGFAEAKHHAVIILSSQILDPTCHVSSPLKTHIPPFRCKIFRV